MFCSTKAPLIQPSVKLSPDTPTATPHSWKPGRILRDFRQQKRHLWEINILFGPGHEASPVATGARGAESRGWGAWAALELCAATLHVHDPPCTTMCPPAPPNALHLLDPLQRPGVGALVAVAVAVPFRCCRWQLLLPRTAYRTHNCWQWCPCRYPLQIPWPLTTHYALRNCAFFIAFHIFLHNYSLHYCISYCWYTRIVDWVRSKKDIPKPARNN